jgi:hypothetical protein
MRGGPEGVSSLLRWVNLCYKFTTGLFVVPGACGDTLRVTCLAKGLLACNIGCGTEVQLVDLPGGVVTAGCI